MLSNFWEFKFCVKCFPYWKVLGVFNSCCYFYFVCCFFSASSSSSSVSKSTLFLSNVPCLSITLFARLYHVLCLIFYLTLFNERKKMYLSITYCFTGRFEYSSVNKQRFECAHNLNGLFVDLYAYNDLAVCVCVCLSRYTFEEKKAQFFPRFNS